MRHEDVGQVEDYTGAFLIMSYLTGIFGLVLLWHLLGYWLALAACAVLHFAIARLDRHLAEREANWTARVKAALDRAHGAGRGT